MYFQKYLLLITPTTITIAYKKLNVIPVNHSFQSFALGETLMETLFFIMTFT